MDPEKELDFGNAAQHVIDALESGGQRFSDDQIDQGLQKAQEMIQSSERKQGFQDMQNLTLSIGMPAPRAIWTALVENGAATDEEKATLLAEVKRASEPDNIKDAVGCIRVDFINPETDKPDTVYLVLDRCLADHDLGAQLEKIDPLITEVQRSEIRKHLAFLIFSGRSVFTLMHEEHRMLIAKICKHCPYGTPIHIAAGAVARGLQVDPKNTTLGLHPDWADRVGIFARLQSEIDAKAGAADAGAADAGAADAGAADAGAADAGAADAGAADAGAAEVGAETASEGGQK